MEITMSEAFDKWWSKREHKLWFKYDQELAFIFFEEVWLSAKGENR